ncbi:integrase core domain-containing protein [Streptomyces sp. NPDC007875]|uniref:integrase core domain-containing protein n=1 Tax=Streptomyces sp. NPDC007875 TaxID=3364783 RepID=UPI0036B786E8
MPKTAIQGNLPFADRPCITQADLERQPAEFVLPYGPYRLPRRELGNDAWRLDRHRRFDAVFAGNGTAVIPTPSQSPRSSAFAERWIRTARAECTDRLLITGERHLRTVLNQCAEHSNTGRAHRSLGLRAPDDDPNVIPLPAAAVRRRRVPGGLLNEYHTTSPRLPHQPQETPSSAA